MSAPAFEPRDLHQPTVYLTPEDRDGDPIHSLLHPPRPLRWLAQAVGVMAPLLLLALLFMPWQQSAQGSGRVIAYAPQEREQSVQAPISGVITAWYVSEGQRVREGDPLVEMGDPDPELLSRLTAQRAASQDALSATQDQIRSYQTKLAAEQAAKELVLAEYEAKISSLMRKRTGEVSELDTEQRQLERLEILAAEGISSTRDLDVIRTKRDKAKASLEALDREIASVRQAQGKAGADADAKIAAVQADLDAAEAKVANAREKLVDQEVKVSRQERQVIRAPRDGVVLRLYNEPGAGAIKSGDTLVSFVPDTDTRAVELYVDGNDVPLMGPGEDVRLVFEGWPALQVVGWGTSRGTFGGQVAFVDATDDGSGKFRIVVLPDPQDVPWPSAERLRQGVRAKGWVLLGQVSLGYELWRQINGFPPLPPIDKGNKATIPSSKKPRAPSALQ